MSVSYSCIGLMSRYASYSKGDSPMQKFLLDPSVKIGCMETKEELCEQRAYLPDGQLVVIEEVHADGYATVRRIEGEWKGRIAVCAMNKLKPMLTKQEDQDLVAL